MTGPGVVTCSCGSRLAREDVEAHAEGHGLEGDTYTAAQLRQWLASLGELAPDAGDLAVTTESPRGAGDDSLGPTP